MSQCEMLFKDPLTLKEAGGGSKMTHWLGESPAISHSNLRTAYDTLPISDSRLRDFTTDILREES